MRSLPWPQLSRIAHFTGDTAGALERAQQTQRILAAGDLGWTMRFTGHFVTEVLIDSGGLTAARRSVADTLAWAREAGDLSRQAYALAQMADLDLRAGNITESGQHLREATEIAARTGEHRRLIGFLDLWAYLCAATGQWAEAVTSWAAFKACLEAEELGDMPLSVQRRQEPLRKAIQALGPARARAAEERGAAMTLDTATEFVLMAANAGGRAPSPPAPSSGLAQLSAREQELVTLVARGHTDSQDRRPAVHQREHRPLSPGPHPGQDRLPAPRRPDPAGPASRARLTPRPYPLCLGPAVGWPRLLLSRPGRPGTAS